MNKLISSIFSLLTLLFVLSGCESGTETEYDTNPAYTLSQEDSDALVKYTRKFLSKNPKLKLTDAEKTCVNTIDPTCKTEYRSYKNGHLEMAWETESRRIRVVCDGDFTNTSKCKWEVALINIERFQDATKAPPLPKEEEIKARMKEKAEKEAKEGKTNTK